MQNSFSLFGRLANVRRKKMVNYGHRKPIITKIILLKDPVQITDPNYETRFKIWTICP